MKAFKQYLIDLRYNEATITAYLNINKRFIKWVQSKRLKTHTLTYDDILLYVQSLQQKDYQSASINNQLVGICKYMNYLIDRVERTDNPTDGIQIKGQVKKIKANLLSSDELEDLYYSYSIQHKNPIVQARRIQDKVMIGLLVCQGITAKELYYMQTDHIDLRTGKITIPATTRSNTRTLVIKPWQMMDMITYSNQSRKLLEPHTNPSHQEQLFYGSLNKIHNTIARITKRLKQYNQKVENHTQIRASVITLWLQQHNLRKTQYMAGHRHISSTEKYLQTDIDNLHDMVNTLHPIQ